jgi:hypothetical protein
LAARSGCRSRREHGGSSQGLVEAFYDRRLAVPGVVTTLREFASRRRKALLQTVRGTKRHSVQGKLSVSGPRW